MFAAFSSHYILRQIRAGNGWPPICGHYRGGLVSLLWVSAEWRDPRSVSRCNCPRLSWRQPLLRDQRFRSGTPVCFAPVHERATRQSEAYFIRRLTRLEPPYILNLFICFALVVIAENGNPRALLPHLGASMLYLHNLLY